MASKLKRPEKKKPLRPARSQKRQPAVEKAMRPSPQFENADLKGSGRLTAAARSCSTTPPARARWSASPARWPASWQKKDPGQRRGARPDLDPFPPGKVASFGSDTPLGRAVEPWECAECYVFLASADSNYMTGQVLHPKGGEIIND